MQDYSHLPPHLRWPLKLYKLTLSPAIQLTGIQCRHAPTCSEYMCEAVHIHGPVSGGWLGVKRVCRCHPWGTTGYDPVPKAPTNWEPNEFDRPEQQSNEKSDVLNAANCKNIPDQGE